MDFCQLLPVAATSSCSNSSCDRRRSRKTVASLLWMFPLLVSQEQRGEELPLECRRMRNQQEGDRGEGNWGVRRLLRVRSVEESVRDAGTEKPGMPGELIGLTGRAVGKLDQKQNWLEVTRFSPPKNWDGIYTSSFSIMLLSANNWNSVANWALHLLLWGTETRWWQSTTLSNQWLQEVCAMYLNHQTSYINCEVEFLDLGRSGFAFFDM